MNSSVLWVTPKWPLPIQDGARRATSELLGKLTRINPDVDLLAFAGPDEQCDEDAVRESLGVRGVHVIRTKIGNIAGNRYLGVLSGILSNPNLPVSVSRYASRSVRAEAREVVRATRPHVMVLDGLHPAAAWFERGAFKRPDSVGRVVYRAHNVESDLWFQSASGSRWPLSHFFVWQAKLMRRLEWEVIGKTDGVCTVSQEDQSRFQQAVPSAKVNCIPIGVDLSEVPAAMTGAAPVMLFVGRLDWAPNREGLHWLLSQVWRKAVEKRPDLALEIVGSGNADWLREFSDLPGVSYHGCVPDLRPYYERCCAALVPIFQGSGTRVKAIEAAKFARPCVGTAIGMQGSGLVSGRDFLPAETKEDWIQVLSEISGFRCEELGRSAYESALSRLDSSRLAREFQSVLESE